eukprot:1159929-Pelagomonas_calceolata.AAC.14
MHELTGTEQCNRADMKAGAVAATAACAKVQVVASLQVLPTTGTAPRDVDPLGVAGTTPCLHHATMLVDF